LSEGQKVQKLVYGIGGGNPADPRMLEHYSRIVDLARASISGRREPRIALLPTAHHNGTHAKLTFRKFIADRFTEIGCRCREILLGDVPAGEKATSNADVEEILSQSDALYVLGGDTRYLLNVLSDRDLISVFHKHFESGLILSGSSAGLIWLADVCMSDSESFSEPEGWRFVMIDGIGIIPMAVNAHDNQGVSDGVLPGITRMKQFEMQLRKIPDTTGLAVDEFAALEIRDGKCKVRSHQENTGAYLLAVIDSRIRRRKIEGEVNLMDPEGVMDYILCGQ